MAKKFKSSMPLAVRILAIVLTVLLASSVITVAVDFLIRLFN